MIKLKTEEDIAILREGGRRLAKILGTVAREVKVGVETRALDDLAEKLILAGGDKPAFLHYKPAGSRLAYPASLCVSINEEIVHGLPSLRKIVDGDVVSLDLGLVHNGLYTDMAVTVAVGKIGELKQKMIEVAKEALSVGIKAARVGGHIGDISEAIENFVMKQGFAVVLDLAGHGVGFAAHEDPFIPNYGQKGKGVKIEEGLVIAIEPMVTIGDGRIKLEKDEFTFTTRNKEWCAHFEHTIAMTKKGPQILTKL